MKKLNLFCWKPTRELYMVLLAWILITATFYISFQVITVQRVAGMFITFGVVGIALLGILLPAVWNTLVKKRPLSAIGIKKDRIALNLVLCALLAVIQYMMTLAKITLPGWREVVPLLTMLVAVGLFENIFFRGWAQLRFEEAFGIIPGILLSAGIYCLYHVGYGMSGAELMPLFIVGLVYSVIFRLTRSIFILFPFLTPMGALFTNLKEGLSLPFAATYGFLDVIVLGIAGLMVIHKLYQKKRAADHCTKMDTANQAAA